MHNTDKKHSAGERC